MRRVSSCAVLDPTCKASTLPFVNIALWSLVGRKSLDRRVPDSRLGSHTYSPLGGAGIRGGLTETSPKDHLSYCVHIGTSEPNLSWSYLD